jgi:uncharacterized DUF497 family protein
MKFFTFDKNKEAKNIEKHGISLLVGVAVFLDEKAVIEESIRSNEVRTTAIGMTELGVLFVVFIERIENEFRLISVRKANKKERIKYVQNNL